MIYIRNFVADKINRYEHLLKKARESYQRTKHESWGARMAELQSVVNELKLVLNKINHEIEFNS